MFPTFTKIQLWEKFVKHDVFINNIKGHEKHFVKSDVDPTHYHNRLKGIALFTSFTIKNLPVHEICVYQKLISQFTFQKYRKLKSLLMEVDQRKLLC